MTISILTPIARSSSELVIAVDHDEEEAPLALVSSSLETAEPSENSSLYISSTIGFHSRTRALMNQFDICSSSPQVFVQLVVNHAANCNAKCRLVLSELRAALWSSSTDLASAQTGGHRQLQLLAVVGVPVALQGREGRH